MTIRIQPHFSKAASGLLLMLLATACDPAATTDAGPTGDGGATDAQMGTDAQIGTDGAMPSIPTVLATGPIGGATDVAPNTSVSVTFSEPMASASLGATSFTLTSGDPAVLVPGTIIYSDSTAVFWPSAQLAIDTMFTATVTTSAMSALGAPLAADHVWSFTTGSTFAPGLPVNLGTAGDFVILAKTGISTVPTSAITGDIAVSPAAASFITGFALTADSTNVFSTAPQVTGRIYAANYAPPTPSNLTTAISDMQLAFTDAAGRAPGITELGAGSIGGMTLAPGVYGWGTGLLIPTDVTLNGSATDVWIFQVAGDLTMSSGAQVLLEGGALPQNIFWQVAGAVDLGTTSHCEGVVICMTAVTLRTGASINGRILAQTAVDIDGSTVVAPAD